MAKKKLRAALYLRRSSKDQEGSIQDQKTACHKYADDQGNFHIIATYTDDGISGDNTEARTDFLRMRDDAVAGKFDAVLCWDQDRFGRFDSVEAGHWIYPFRQAGVQLVTVNDGIIDWNDFTARLMYTIKQEGKHQFLVDLSRNVARGQLEAANAGSWVGKAPYGYTLAGPTKQKTLVEDDAKLAVVRRIFAQYVDAGKSMVEIARGLTADGILSPTGLKQWQGGSVKFILANRVYIGTYQFNTRGSARYYHIKGGSVIKGSHSGPKPEEDWITITDHHPPVIDHGMFEKAVAMLDGNRNGQTNYPGGDNPYLFSGILRCGICGHVMAGDQRSGIRRYRCNRRQGVDTCRGTLVHEDNLATHIRWKLSHVVGDVLDRGTMEGLLDLAEKGKLTDQLLPKGFDRLRKMLLGESAATTTTAPKNLQAQINRLDAKVATIRRNLAYVSDPANIPAMESEIAALTAQRGNLVVQLADVATPADVNAKVMGVYAVLTCMQSSDDNQLRRVLREVAYIKVNTTTTGTGTRTRYTLQGVTVALYGVRHLWQRRRARKSCTSKTVGPDTSKSGSSSTT